MSFMAEQSKNISYEKGDVSLYTIVTDILRNWLAILLIMVTAGMLTYVYLHMNYHPTYTTKATMVITRTGVDNNVYGNLRSAASSAERFAQLLNSSAMQKVVAKDLDIPYFNGSCRARNLENSNLLELSVTADSPGMAFHEMKSILKNYKTFSEDLLGNINLIMLQAPSVPENPGNPMSAARKILQVMALAGAAVAAGLGLLSYMRDTVRTPADVEQKLDTHILATLYHEQKYGNVFSRIRNWRKKTSSLITDPVTSFRYTESVKRMVARIVSRMNSRKAKVLMLTSVLENEGKSTVAANIALAIADEGRKVLLVDADLRKPSLYKILKMQDHEFVSLTKVLRTGAWSESEMEDLCVSVPGTNLKAVLNRSGAPQSMEMFSSGRFVELLDHFRREYDYIVVDTPPMQLVADAEEMAPIADACALVIRQHTVEARDINDALDALNGNKDHVIGCIFNNVHSGLPLPGSGRGYGYGYGNYGYGGHYGKTS